MPKRGEHPVSLKNVRPPNPEGVVTSKGVRLSGSQKVVNFWEGLTTKQRGELVREYLELKH